MSQINPLIASLVWLVPICWAAARMGPALRRQCTVSRRRDITLATSGEVAFLRRHLRKEIWIALSPIALLLAIGFVADLLIIILAFAGIFANKVLYSVFAGYVLLLLSSSPLFGVLFLIAADNCKRNRDLTIWSEPISFFAGIVAPFLLPFGTSIFVGAIYATSSMPTLVRGALMVFLSILLVAAAAMVYIGLLQKGLEAFLKWYPYRE